jgi:hypothetical protein
MGDFGNNSGLDDVVDNIALEDDDLSLATNAQCTSKVRKYWQLSQGMFPCLQLPFVAGGGTVSLQTCLPPGPGMIPMGLMNPMGGAPTTFHIRQSEFRRRCPYAANI